MNDSPDTPPVAATGAPAITTRGLSKDFGDVHAVVDVDLDIPKARIFGFLGPNGSGKTTAIRMMCGLLTPTRGDISVLGMKVPEQAEALRRKVGYMTQKFSLYTDLTIAENLDFIAGVYNMNRATRRSRIEEVTERYRLGSYFNKYAGAISGGQQQRLALACAMLHEPELLFLDEPTSAVDPENRRAFWESLFDLVEDNTTILVSTHYMDEAERCHALAILDRGRLVAHGSPAQLGRDIDAVIVLLDTDQPRRAGKLLHAHDWVRSVAQVGNRLRVLVRRDQPDPAGSVGRLVRDAGLAIQRCEPGEASLEDVFVAATLDPDTGGS